MQEDSSGDVNKSWKEEFGVMAEHVADFSSLDGAERDKSPPARSQCETMLVPPVNRRGFCFTDDGCLVLFLKSCLTTGITISACEWFEEKKKMHLLGVALMVGEASKGFHHNHSSHARNYQLGHPQIYKYTA